MALGFLTLLACGGDESGPGDDAADAASEADAEVDAAGEGGDAQPEDAGESGDAHTDEPDAGSATPQIALSGDALRETLAIGAPLSVSLRKSSDQSTLLHLAASAELQVTFTFTFAGAPAEGESYAQTRDGVSCALSVTRTSDNATWDAAHGIAGADEQGDCSLSLRSVMQSLDAEALTQYVVHGTVDGTLPAKQGSGAEGSVVLHATF